MWALIIMTVAISACVYYFTRRLDHPVFLFSVLWGFIYVLYQVELFSLTEVNENSLAILIVMTLCFPLGCFF